MGRKANPYPVNRRELELLTLVKEGCTTQEIAIRMGKTVGSVGVALATVSKRLGVVGRKAAVQACDDRDLWTVYERPPEAQHPLPTTHDVTLDLPTQIRSLQSRLRRTQRIIMHLHHGHLWWVEPGSKTFVCQLCSFPTYTPQDVQMTCATMRRIGYGHKRRVSTDP